MPLICSTEVSIKNLLARGKERGYVTYDELNAALPPEEVSSEQIKNTMAALYEMGINVVENEDAEDFSSARDSGIAVPRAILVIRAFEVVIDSVH